MLVPLCKQEKRMPSVVPETDKIESVGSNKQLGSYIY
jgi:hypothetical protein